MNLQITNWTPSLKPFLRSKPPIHRTPIPETDIIVGKPIKLPPKRHKIVSQTHSKIDELWSNGGLIFNFYSTSNQINSLPEAMEAIEMTAYDRLLPKPVAGLSTAFLRNGGLWNVNVQQFADAIYWALTQGGAYTQKKDLKHNALSLTRQYMQALSGNETLETLNCYEMDICCSSWFFGVYWDFAYLVSHRVENWFGLIMATDTD